MSKHAAPASTLLDTATRHAAEVQEASARWWQAHEGGAPAEHVQRLWEELAALCSSRPAPRPEDDAVSRFGWMDGVPTARHA